MNLRLPTVCVLLTCLGLMGGCPVNLEDLEDIIINHDRDDALIVDDADDVFVEDYYVIEDQASFISDPSVIVIEELPDITLLTFDNLTGLGLVISSFVEDVFQEVSVLADETVYIEYPCLAVVQLDFEHDYDPLTGFYLGSFDLGDIFVEEGFDYFCGDEIVFTFDFDSVFVDVFPL
jgi:hypothetical protein